MSVHRETETELVRQTDRQLEIVRWRLVRWPVRLASVTLLCLTAQGQSRVMIAIHGPMPSLMTRSTMPCPPSLASPLSTASLSPCLLPSPFHPSPTVSHRLQASLVHNSISGA